MQTRRRFIGNVATGLAGSFATGRVLGANERIRVGVIGAGDRGTQLVRELMACPDTEIAAFADVYKRRLEEALALSPGAKTGRDYHDLLADPSIDAVVIATPQHLHADCFAAAMEAGKHVYQEKTMAFTLEQAKLMRAAWQRAGRIVQVGHQACSTGQVRDASNYLASGGAGRVTAIRAHMYRNTPHGKAPWSRPVFPDMTPEQIDWKAFLGSAPAHEFDANRYANWRFFWDYSGGNVHENMSHQLAFWYKVMDLRIPWAVTMTGGIYRWKDGREVPDTMNVSMEHPEHELQFSWDSGFGSNHPGVTEEVLGTDGTIIRGQQIRYLPQKVNRPEGTEMLGQTPTAPHSHVRNFLDCIRAGGEINCPVEIGFRVSVACRMAVESYRLGRTVYWDAAKEEIV
jgi:predicted dehydrogenase